MRISLEIPGGPLDVVISGYKKEPFIEMGWWTVGGRKLLVSSRQGQPWALTGEGRPATQKRHEAFPLPPRSMREAFRAFLRKQCRPGDAVDAFSTDRHEGNGCRWGWDDCASWAYRTPNDGAGRLVADDAVKWMRQQAQAVGMSITMEGS